MGAGRVMRAWVSTLHHQNVIICKTMMDDECVYAVSVEPASWFSATRPFLPWLRIMSAAIFILLAFIMYINDQWELID
jgi:hypothetical protein